MSRNLGLNKNVVRGLRDDAVKLALSVNGAPLPDDVVDRALDKYKLNGKQREALKKL